MKKFICLGLSCLLFYTGFCFAENKYHYDESRLNLNQHELYNNIRSTLNDWTGEYKKLRSAKEMIDSYIVQDSLFLPIFIEQARYTIMMGYTETQRKDELNLQALSILKEIQRKSPSYPKSYVLAGHIYTNLKDFKNAELSLVKAGSYKTTDPWFYQNWSTLLGLQGKYKEALEYSKLALKHSRDNNKSLVAAIIDIDSLSSRVNKSNSYGTINFVFDSYSDPIERIRISERLISSYSGRRNILNTAYQIIMRQKHETPNLLLCDVELANLILVSGIKYVEGGRTVYMENNRIEAEKILLQLQGKGVADSRVFDMLVDVYLDTKDFKKLDTVTESAVKNKIPEIVVLRARAKVLYHKGEYRRVVELLEEVYSKDPSFSDTYILADSYKRLGDKKKMKEYYLRKIALSPQSAWAKGDYAGYLYTQDDTQGAIEYGKMALEIMEYPNAKNITGISYLIEAAKSLSLGITKNTLSLYDKGKKTGVSNAYISENCWKYCENIMAVKRLKENQILEN